MVVALTERKPAVFVREATGLVREVSAWSSFMATFMMVTGGVLVLWTALMYAAPGANWPLAFAIAFIPNLLMASMFTIVGMSLPRSGGDYVFTSRALNPFLGFVNYWGVAWAFITQVGIFAYYASSYIGYLLAGLGAYYNAANLANLGTSLTSPTSTLALGLVVVVAVTLMANVMRPRWTWGITFWGGIVTIITTIIMYAAFASFNANTFSASFNSFMGNSTAYTGVIQQGGITPPANGMLATAAALPITWFYYSYFNLPTSWSGEMKNVKKSMPIAIIVGLTATFIYYVFMAVTIGGALGQPFLENWGSLAASGTAPVPGVGGFVPFFALLVFHNVPLYFIMFIALWLPTILYMVPVIVGATRYMFAWAFDRVLPDKLASVNETIHTPLYSTAIVFVGAIASVALMAFLPNSGEFATLSFTIFSFGFIIPAIAAVILPFHKKELYETAFVVKKKFILPLISWLGLGTAMYLSYSVYLSSTPAVNGLPINSFSETMYGAIYGSAIIIFIIAYVRNRRRGLPLDLVFKEIPPE